MKTTELIKLVGVIIFNKPGINVKQIHEELKGAAGLPQIHSAIKQLVDSNHAILNEGDDKVKTYTLSAEGEAVYKNEIVSADETQQNDSDQNESNDSQDDDENNTEKGKVVEKPAGRDLTKYIFNGLNDLSKGRLALAVIRHIAVTNPKIKIKELLESFPDILVAPYGVIKPRKEALEISKGRPRFFIKEEEMVKIFDGFIAVSNQWTSERINEFISISKKKYGLKIKTQ